MIGVSVLGSTGSIGKSTLDVLSRHADRYRVVALTANQDVQGLFRQCLAFRPQLAVMADHGCALELRSRLKLEAPGIEVLAGVEGLEQAACHTEAGQVMAAIVGSAGLLPTLAAVRQGKRILLANKEALVVSGRLFMDAARESGAVVLPIDSEHNAIFQCLPEGFGQGPAASGIRRILLTASGGPFRTLDSAALKDVTPAQACAHPNWDMGRKISVDSATMMNKGLEVIEARWLFSASPEMIEVVVHPQSVIHSMVEYEDGSILAQMGNPDMRTPIAHALAWPERIDSGVASLDFFKLARLDFEPPDRGRFPCLGLAYQAVSAGKTAPAVLNAANEVAVASFLAGALSFTGIAEIIDRVLQESVLQPADELPVLLEADRQARELAERFIMNAVS